MVACMVAASVNGLYGCDDDKDFSYNGNLDLNLLGLKQAREIWDGSQCNIKNAFDSDSVVVDFSYDLSLALYQNRKAEKDVVVGLTVDADTLTKATARQTKEVSTAYMQMRNSCLRTITFSHRIRWNCLPERLNQIRWN